MWQIIQLFKGDPSKENPTEPPGWEVIYQIEEEDKEVNSPYIIFLGLSLVTILFAILLKQIKFLRKITEYVPESGCLMAIGVVIYYILYGINYVSRLKGNEWKPPSLTSSTGSLNTSWLLPLFFMPPTTSTILISLDNWEPFLPSP